MTEQEQKAMAQISTMLRAVFYDAIGGASLEQLRSKDKDVQEELVTKAWDKVAKKVMDTIAFTLGQDRGRITDTIRKAIGNEIIAQANRLSQVSNGALYLVDGLMEAGNHLLGKDVASEWPKVEHKVPE